MVKSINYKRVAILLLVVVALVGAFFGGLAFQRSIANGGDNSTSVTDAKDLPKSYKIGKNLVSISSEVVDTQEKLDKYLAEHPNDVYTLPYNTEGNFITDNKCGAAKESYCIVANPEND